MKRPSHPLDPELAGAPGLQSTEGHPLIAATRDLRERYGLWGCVVISFSDDRVGVNASGRNDVTYRAMQQLADRILARIDAGEFDPDLPEAI